MGELIQVPRRTLTLAFDEGALTGAEIEVEVTLDAETYWAVKQWFGQAAAATTKDDQMAAARELADLFGPRLRSWNLADENGPIPATTESVRKLDIVLLAAIVADWHRALGSVPLPSPGASPTGPVQTAGRRKNGTPGTAGSRTGASSPRRSTPSRTSPASSVSAP